MLIIKFTTLSLSLSGTMKGENKDNSQVMGWRVMQIAKTMIAPNMKVPMKVKLQRYQRE